MKLTNIGNFNDIASFVKDKTERFSKEEKTLKSLFYYMFSERDNIFSETSDGFRIKKTTYGECFDSILQTIPVLKEKIKAPKNSIVGLYLQNSPDFIKLLWAILGAGYRPLLMNLRLSKSVLENILKDNDVACVITDSEVFSVETITASEILSIQSEKTTDVLDFSDEIIFMSSGTSDSVKLCFYNGENFFYQVCDSLTIIENCPDIKEHYEGELKQLCLLPFYHIFGFVAVYIWFGFYSRTFVFLKDLSPETLVNTIKKHKVTHVFAVPLVWETVYKKALGVIKSRGEKTYSKFKKGLKISLKGGFLGKIIRKKALKEVRDNIFGDSIKFIISGGSSIKKEVLEFFNGIGYHMANGYGMTEVGITSVELSSKSSVLCSGTIGKPFTYSKYEIATNGELLIKSKTRAFKIVENGFDKITDFNEFFKTRDLARLDGDRYFIDGRLDDLIIASDGENINPQIIEANLNIPDSDGFSVFCDKNNQPILLISSRSCNTKEKYDLLYKKATESLAMLHLQKVVKKISITRDSLILGSEFKVSRKKLAKRYENGEITVIGENPKAFENISDELASDIKDIFSRVLKKPISEIDINADFFIDLGGTSLDYFELLNEIKLKYSTDIPQNNGKTLSTVKEFYEFIKNI